MITVTDTAKKHILLAIEEENRADLAVRVGIAGRGGASGFRYRMDLVGLDEQAEGDTVIDAGEFKVLIDPQSVPDLAGATIDFVQRLQESGFKFINPNSPWKDPLAARVQELLDQEINPQIAAHGGVVTLLDVKDNDVFLSMGGGCQGCGMASVTLREGIESTLRQALPEIREIFDNTDHAAGANPYYAR